MAAARQPKVAREGLRYSLTGGERSYEARLDDGRWLLVSPEIYGLLLKSPEFIKASDLGDAVVQTGAVGRIAGFTVFEDSTLGENVEYIAGHPNWFFVKNDGVVGSIVYP